MDPARVARRNMVKSPIAAMGIEKERWYALIPSQIDVMVTSCITVPVGVVET